jgi:hypothetical protein
MSSLFVDFNKKQLGLTALVMGAVMIVISLAWSNAITALIDNYVPQKYANSKNAWYKVVYALLLTIVATIIVNNF